MVVGFLGSTPRIVKKFVDLYTGLGFVVVCVIPSAMELFYFPAGRRLAQDLVYFLQQNCGRAQSYVWAPMSNNGAVLYSNVLSLGDEDPTMRLCIPAVVFDCCPGKLVVSRGIRALRTSQGLGWALTALTSVLFPLLMFLTRLLIPVQRRGFTGYWRRATTPPQPDSRFLFLYSATDSLCDAAFVEDAIKEIAASSDPRPEIVPVVFQIAGHCSLLKDEPQKYVSALTGFFCRGADGRTACSPAQ